MNDGRSASGRLVFGGATLGAGLVLAFGCSGTAPPPDVGSLAGTSNGSSGSSAAAAGNQSSAGKGGIGVGGASTGAGGGVAVTGGTGGTGNDCAATTSAAKLLPLDLFLLTDSSKSMLKTTGAGSTKWEALKGAMSGFFADPGGEGLSVALRFFPDVQPTAPATCTDDASCGEFGPCDTRKACVTAGTFNTAPTTICSTDAECATGEVCAPVQECPEGANCAKSYCVSSGAETPCPAACIPFDSYCRSRDVCSAPTYAAPTVPIAELPAGAQALADALTARMPDGYTPTGPSLTGAIQAAQTHQAANPGHKVAVVLVTDGLPGGFIPDKPPPECTPGDVMGVQTLLMTSSAGAAPIPTFVIGVFGPCDLVNENIKPQENLDLWAGAGGTTKAIMISTDKDVAAELRTALGDIRKAAIECRYATPNPMETDVDYLKVNVTSAVGDAMATTHAYVTNAAGCDPTTGGWYYDVDPKQAGSKPKEIVICEQTCNQFQEVAGLHVDIAYGCPTYEPK